MEKELFLKLVHQVNTNLRFLSVEVIQADFALALIFAVAFGAISAKNALDLLRNCWIVCSVYQGGEETDHESLNVYHGRLFDLDGANPGSGPQISSSNAKTSGSACFSSPATKG